MCKEPSARRDLVLFSESGKVTLLSTVQRKSRKSSDVLDFFSTDSFVPSTFSLLSSSSTTLACRFVPRSAY